MKWKKQKSNLPIWKSVIMEIGTAIFRRAYFTLSSGTAGAMIWCTTFFIDFICINATQSIHAFWARYTARWRHWYKFTWHWMTWFASFYWNWLSWHDSSCIKFNWWSHDHSFYKLNWHTCCYEKTLTFRPPRIRLKLFIIHINSNFVYRVNSWPIRATKTNSEKKEYRLFWNVFIEHEHKECFFFTNISDLIKVISFFNFSLRAWENLNIHIKVSFIYCDCIHSCFDFDRFYITKM